MRARYKVLLIIIALLIFITLGVSFAYYISNIKTDGEGAKIETQTANVGNATIHVVGNLDDELPDEPEKDILPGHISIGKVTVYATKEEAVEDFEVNYNLIWEGTNNLSIPLKYKVYKTTNPDVKINVSCKQIKNIIGSQVRYSESCNLSSEYIDLNNVYAGNNDEDVIPVSEANQIVVLVNNESLKATEDGEPVHYIVVVEYENKDENQSQDMSTDNTTKGLSGRIKVEPILEDVDFNNKFKDYIMANTPLQTDDPDFSKTSCSSGCEEDTVGLYECIIKEDGQCAEYDDNRNPIDDEGNILDTTNLTKTYYYRGDVENNYVEFAGIYWRIIRINENGSLRLIYSGEVPYVKLTGKEIVLANGYNDSITLYTQITTSKFSSSQKYVGFLYKPGVIHGTNNKSTILAYVLEPWYESNIIGRKYGSYIDTESGFCGARTAYADEYGTLEGQAADGDIYYERYIEFSNNETPSLTYNCNNNLDLYTVDNIRNIGNEGLTYPVGLISVDEVAFAGGTYLRGSSDYNQKYYLYNGYQYWTISPAYYNNTYGGYMMHFSTQGSLYPSILYKYRLDNDTGEGVRPVINVSPNKLNILGSGTIDDPYTFQ